MFTATSSNAIISNSKNICSIFFCISGIYMKFGILWYNRWASQAMCFRNYRLQKARLLNCLKSSLSEHLWTVKTLKSPLHWSLSRKLSSKNSLLVVSEILRLLVKSLTPDNKYSLSVKANPQRNHFKCNYLQIGKYFLNFFLHFRNLHKIWNNLKRKMTLRGDFFLLLSTANNGLT